MPQQKKSDDTKALRVALATNQKARDSAIAAEKAALKAALIAEHGAVRRAALILGLHVSTVQRAIARFGLRDWLDRAYPLAVRQPSEKKQRATKRKG